jgi:diguanylate cyclase (GGDEF)-like protein
MLDLSRFKEVNDTLGHDVGDEVLREVARRFSAQLQSQAFISRIGGDEFAVVLADVAGHSAIDELAERLVAGLRAPIEARGIAIEVGVNIGIAVAPDHGLDARELLRHADVAMYSAKRHGAGFEYYDMVADHHTVRRLGMLSELRTAIDGDGIALHYQPQVSLQTGSTESVEALVRWRHPMHGDVSPAEFVALAEATDLIHPLTYWVIRTALKDIAAWRDRGVTLRVAINVSARVLQDVEFPARSCSRQRRSGRTTSSSRSPRVRCSSILRGPSRSSRPFTVSACASQSTTTARDSRRSATSGICEYMP